MSKHKVLIGICGLSAVLATSIVLAMSKPSLGNDFIRIGNLDGHTPVVLLDDEVIYSDLSDAGYILGKRTFDGQNFDNIGHLNGFYMSSGIPVIANDTMYLPVTLSDQGHVLLKLNTSNNSVSSIPIVDDGSEPLDSIAIMGDDIYILSHKRADNSLYISTIRSFDDMNGEKICLESEMNDGMGQVITAFSCNEERMYTFVDDVSGTITERYVNVYNSDLDLLQTLRIKDDSPFRHSNDIAQMYVLGDYIYSRDYSDYGILSKINDDVLEPVFGADGLRFSYNAKNADNKAYLLFIRGESKYYILDTSTDSWLEGELLLGELESIRNAISDGDDFCFSILDDSIKDRFATKDIYVYSFSNLLKQTSPLSVK